MCLLSDCCVYKIVWRKVMQRIEKMDLEVVDVHLTEDGAPKFQLTHITGRELAFEMNRMRRKDPEAKAYWKENRERIRHWKKPEEKYRRDNSLDSRMKDRLEMYRFFAKEIASDRIFVSFLKKCLLV